MPLGEVNNGPMRCSKTTHGVIVANTLHEADPNARIVYVRPAVDTRGDPLVVTSRGGGVTLSIPPFTTNDVGDLYEHARSAALCIIDEGQMFKPALAPVMLRLAIEHSVHVMYFGLDTTWKGELFATTAAACALPGFKVYSHKSHCVMCRKDEARRIMVRPTAIFSQKLRDGIPVSVLDPNEPTFEPGDAQYQPLCWNHWFATTPGAYEALALGQVGRIAPETEWRDRR